MERTPRLLMKLRGACACVLIIGVSWLCISCQSSDPRVIRIISSLPRTGVDKQQADLIVRGIRMAIEEIEGRVGVFRVEYLDLDNSTAAAGQWTSEAEAANARRALQDPNVVAYIGTLNSGAAKVSMPILNFGDLLMVSPAATAVGLTKPGLGEPVEPSVYRPKGTINFARVVPADDLQGTLSAEWVKRRGFETVYVLDDGQVYGRGIADLFAARCREINVSVLGHDSIDPRAREFKSLMTSVKSTSPELIYFGGSVQSKGGQLAKDMSSAGIDVPLLVPDGCKSKAFIDSAGANLLEGRCFVTFGGLPPERLTGKGAAFVERYQHLYSELPEGYAVYGYEAARVVLAAVEEVGSKNRSQITKSALNMENFDGALGEWEFDENGDTTLDSLSVSVVREGRFEFIETITSDEVDSE